MHLSKAFVFFVPLTAGPQNRCNVFQCHLKACSACSGIVVDGNALPTWLIIPIQALAPHEAMFGSVLHLGDLTCKTGIMQIRSTFCKTLGAKCVQAFASFRFSGLRLWNRRVFGSVVGSHPFVFLK